MRYVLYWKVDIGQSYESLYAGSRMPLTPRFENIKDRILLLRGQSVMLDRDLAVLYGVRTKHLNQQVERNRRRFPSDFAFQLTHGEAEEIRVRMLGQEGSPSRSFARSSRHAGPWSLPKIPR